MRDSGSFPYVRQRNLPLIVLENLMSQTVKTSPLTSDFQQSFSAVLALPDGLAQGQIAASADPGTPFAAGDVQNTTYYRYKDSPSGHEHFTTGM